MDTSDVSKDDTQQVTLSMLPDDWKTNFFSNPYHLVKFTIFSWKTNILLSKQINHLLFNVKKSID